MEKLIYIVWKPDARTPMEFKQKLLGTVAARLKEHGAHKLAFNLVDEFVETLLKARLTRLDPPPAGMISFWLDSADERGPIEAEIEAVTSRHAGYLVVESVPLPNTTHTAPVGQRTPGVTMLALLERPDWIAYDDWIAHWHGPPRTVALETQCTYLYVRNVVVRPLTKDAPNWSGIVEEGFPSEAVTNPMLWYDAGGSKEKMGGNMGRMAASCKKFLELDRVESHPTTEYILEGS